MSIKTYIENNYISIGLIFIGITLLIIVIFTLTKPKTTFEKLILESEDIIENLITIGSSLQNYATDYVTTKQGYDITVKGYVDAANIILNNVKVLQTDAKDSYNKTKTALVDSQTAVGNCETYLQNTTSALTMIQNIINGVTPTSLTAANDFGDNLQKILNLQTNVNKNYTDSKEFLNIIYTKYIQSGQQEKGISDNLKNGKDQLDLLITYITTLQNDIKTSPQYSNLIKSIDKAIVLRTQLTGIIEKINDTTIKSKLESMLTKVNNTIDISINYRDNITVLFGNAGSNAGTKISEYNTQLFTIFANVVAIVGTITFQGPYPFSVPISPPSLPDGDNSLLFYKLN